MKKECVAVGIGYKYMYLSKFTIEGEKNCGIFCYENLNYSIQLYSENSRGLETVKIVRSCLVVIESLKDLKYIKI